MVLDQPFFSKRPESLDPVDIHLPLFELVTVVDVETLVATEHQGIVSPPLNNAQRLSLFRYRIMNFFGFSGS
jgi:hypothetical protein